MEKQFSYRRMGIPRAWVLTHSVQWNMFILAANSKVSVSVFQRKHTGCTKAWVETKCSLFKAEQNYVIGNKCLKFTIYKPQRDICTQVFGVCQQTLNIWCISPALVSHHLKKPVKHWKNIKIPLLESFWGTAIYGGWVITPI